MRVVQSFPFEVREIEHAWIPLEDGSRLSARLWLPEEAGPVPAIVEYIPYRKRDDTRWRDEPMHGYFAGHGYAAVRIDVRGSGTSDGLLDDEYSEAEWSDGLQALRWIAAQPWCDGGVGLVGKSWGGINALQIAALRPPELRCVVAVCASDDRWETDAHRMGGCLLADNLVWGSVLQTLAMRPQDPELVGPSWRATWLERMREAPLFAARWLRHGTRDAYWRRGSVKEDYGGIAVPVLAVSGWADAYADTVPRLLAGLSVPVQGWVGPWAHVYPHNGVPGPAAGFLQVAMGWWERWLRGGDAGGAEPAYRAWMSEGGGRPWEDAVARGRWVGEATWPSPRIRPRVVALGGEGASAVSVPWTGTGGLAAGAWCPFGPEDLPEEQGPDDAVSAVFDLPPLGARLEILGAPEVELDLVCDRPWGMVAVRLCDVAPDGTSVRVSYGLLDLAFRDGFEARRPLDPGQRHRVRVPLRHCGHAFPTGHRIRVAVSSSYWPVAWPQDEPFGLDLHPDGCRLTLPERPPRAEDDALPPLPLPEQAPSGALEGEELLAGEARVGRNPATGETTAAARQGWGPDGEPLRGRIEPIGMELGWAIEERFTVLPADPSSARAEVRHVVTSARPGWSARLEVRLSQARSAAGHRVRLEVVGRDGDEEICRRVVEEDVPLPTGGAGPPPPAP